MRVYISVGSHGKVFEFMGGPTGERYPHLLWVFSEKLGDDLIPATLTYSLKSPKKKR